MVISFTIAAPYRGAAPRGRPHPCHEHHHPDPTPPPGLFFKELFRDAGRQRSDSTTFSRRQRSTTSSAPSADKLWDQLDREDPDQSSRAPASRRGSETASAVVESPGLVSEHLTGTTRRERTGAPSEHFNR